MARLPNPGSDNGTWGSILNDYLAQSHKTDGTLKDNIVTNNTIAPNAVNAASIANGTITEVLLDSNVQTKLNQTAPTWNTLSGKPAIVAAGADPATARTAIEAVGKLDMILNILNYGVVTGTSSTQTPAIKAALDANPGKAFYFPPGDYRLDTQLDVTANNSLWIDGRVYAGASMDILINYDNGLTVSNYAQDRYLIGGGIIDGNLLASKTVAVGSVIRFRLGDGLTIVNPINRGVWLKPAGAEVYCNVRIHNTGTTNTGSSVSITTTSGSTAITGTFLSTDVGSPIVGAGIPVGTYLASVTDGTNAVLSRAAIASGTVTAAILSNIAVEADMGDSTFMHMAIRDFTVGVWDKGNNRLVDVHPWVGTTAQQSARYPNSVGFLIGGNSILIGCESDTFRYNFRTAHPGRVLSVTTNSTTTVTSSAGFTNADIGSPIVGEGIPAGATITGYTNSSTVTISATATASATVTATILGSAKVQFTNCRAFANTGNLTDVIAAANPGIVYDIRDGARVIVTSGRYQGHGTTPHAWLGGFSSKFTCTDPIDDVPGSVSGIAEYKRGVKQGPVSFGATVFGSSGGNITLSTNSCQMEVRDGFVEYHFVLIGNVPASGFGGALRIGLPTFPTGALAQSTGRGTLSYLSSTVSPSTFNNVVGCFSSGLAAPGTTVVQLSTVGTGSSAEPTMGAAPSSIANAAIQIWGSLRAPFTYPS